MVFLSSHADGLLNRIIFFLLLSITKNITDDSLRCKLQVCEYLFKCMLIKITAPPSTVIYSRSYSYWYCNVRTHAWSTSIISGAAVMNWSCICSENVREMRSLAESLLMYWTIHQQAGMWALSHSCALHMLILRSPCHRNMSRYYLTLKAKTINQWKMSSNWAPCLCI